MNNTIKFSSHLDGDDYYTQIDLTLNKIILHRNGEFWYKASINKFKKDVIEGNLGWKHIYDEILKNAENLIDLLSKA